MNKVSAIIIGVVAIGLAGGGTYVYRQHQQQQALEQANRLHQQQELELNQARASGRLEPLQAFIEQHPDSSWVETAIYYRDKLIFQQAVDSGDPEMLRQYISEHPTSQWVSSARMHITRLERERQNREIQARIEQERQEAVRDIESTESIPVQTDTLPHSPSATPHTSPTVVESKPARKDDPMERVRRALSIYQKMGKQDRRDDAEAARQQQAEEQRIRECHRLSDLLRQFKRRDRRWYTLNESGAREFLTKPEAARKKRELQQQYEENCSDL